MGKLIIAVVNFPSRQIAGFKSEVLVLGVVLDNNEVVLKESAKRQNKYRGHCV